jgi:hypothetical protein
VGRDDGQDRLAEVLLDLLGIEVGVTGRYVYAEAL